MKIKQILSVFLAVLILSVQCPVVRADAGYRSVHVVKSATNDTVFLTGGTTSTYTRSFTLKDVKNDNDVGIMYKATGSGTVTLALWLEQSFQPPGTEGSADTSYLPTHLVATGINDTNWHMATVDSVVMPYGRFKVIGSGSNASSTQFQIKVAK